MSAVVYRHDGYCVICEAATTFVAEHAWYRDHLLCARCKSIPRERALAHVLGVMVPDWRTKRIHESSPVQRGISAKLAQECPRYTATYFVATQPLGSDVHGFRNEDLERQTFADASFDLVVTLDVMEHVNEPRLVASEVWRTLDEGGLYLFTTPTYREKAVTTRRARITGDGLVDHIELPAEYHGNPISDSGSLVTFHYGYDLPEPMSTWAPFDTTVFRFYDRGRGIIGEFTEVYACEKRTPSRVALESA